MNRPGILNFDAKAMSELKVVSKPQEVAAATPVLVGPVAQRVNTCGCFNKGRSVAAMAMMFPVPCVVLGGFHLPITPWYFSAEIVSGKMCVLR